MKIEFKKAMGLMLGLSLLLSFTTVSNVSAQQGVDGVAGCQSVVVDPSASFEYQQAVCSAAEQNASTSCAAGGNGMCSSPKKDGTMMEGTNCICLHEEEAPVVA